MAETVIVLPMFQAERLRIEAIGKQLLLPSSDRRNVVDLWRVRLDREYEALGHAMGASLDAIARTRVSKEE